MLAAQCTIISSNTYTLALLPGRLAACVRICLGHLGGLLGDGRREEQSLRCGIALCYLASTEMLLMSPCSDWRLPEIQGGESGLGCVGSRRLRSTARTSRLYSVRYCTVFTIMHDADQCVTSPLNNQALEDRKASLTWDICFSPSSL